MSLIGVIASFKTGTYTVFRRAANTIVNGRAVLGAESSFTLDASVQPLRGDDLKVLPEGSHTNKTRVIYSASELQTRRDGYEPDKIIINGEPYEVFLCEPWEAFGGDDTGSHWRSYASKVILAHLEGELEKTLGSLTSSAAGTVV